MCRGAETRYMQKETQWSIRNTAGYFRQASAVMKNKASDGSSRPQAEVRGTLATPRVEQHKPPPSSHFALCLSHTERERRQHPSSLDVRETLNPLYHCTSHPLEDTQVLQRGDGHTPHQAGESANNPPKVGQIFWFVHQLRRPCHKRCRNRGTPLGLLLDHAAVCVRSKLSTADRPCADGPRQQ